MFKSSNLVLILYCPMSFNSLSYYLWHMIVSVGLDMKEKLHITNHWIEGKYGISLRGCL